MTYQERVTRQWIQTFVVDLNLCPFARRELDGGRVVIVATPARTEVALLQFLDDMLTRLVDQPEIETLFLVHAQVLQDFNAYLDFVILAEQLVVERGCAGVFQIASFHPDYRFADAEDAADFSNRSPYPMLHLLRESSVERAVEGHADVAEIPVRNVRALRSLGVTALDQRWRQCFDV